MSTHTLAPVLLADVLRVAIYARVSSERQVKEHTIASQLDALRRCIAENGLTCDPELCFVDDGHTGESVIRPALERLRDQAAAGVIDRVYILCPDRLARKYAYQVLIVDELVRCGVEVVFLSNPLGNSPEENLLLQVQGMIAEYDRAKILENSRRGKLHAARRGSVTVFSGAPYGYHYVSKHDGDGEARYQVLVEEARVVRMMFAWAVQERCSLGEIQRRLRQQGVPSPTGTATWSRTTIWAMLRNPAYKGTAEYGKTSNQPFKRQKPRPPRGKPEQPRRPISRVTTPAEARIMVNVPALVSEDLFAAVQTQLEENRTRKRAQSRGDRYLLQGLVLCKRCGYACSGNGGNSRRQATANGKTPYAYYRCAGSDAFRFGGERLCWNKAVRTDFLDAAVWEDVRSLLAEPERIRAEHERRRDRKNPDGDHEATQVAKLITKIKKSISRLIDAYGEGMLEKSEFEPRITAARERLSRLEAEQKQTAAQAGEESELRLVIGQLEDFAEGVSQTLEQPTWATKREIIRALVKQVEIDQEDVRIVYRVSPTPRNGAVERGRLQDCSGRLGDFA